MWLNGPGEVLTGPFWFWSNSWLIQLPFLFYWDGSKIFDEVQMWCGRLHRRHLTLKIVLKCLWASSEKLNGAPPPLSPVLQADDGEAEDERPIVDDQGNEGDADATDAKRQEKQEEEVWPAATCVVSVPRCLLVTLFPTILEDKSKTNHRKPNTYNAFFNLVHL